MPDAPTTRLGLYKSLSDGSELVDYSQDIGQNWDKVDAAAGFQVVTSGTRPSSPYSGKGIAESNTSYRTYFSNGTAPASASWVQIPNSSSTFDADLDLTSGKQLNIGTSSSPASIAIVNAATTTDAISLRVTGDTQSRFLVDTDGTINWGAGASAATDVTLYRSAANVLRTGDSLTVDIDLTVTGNINSATNLNMGAWTSYTPTWTSSGTQPALGNGTLVGRYARIGRTIVCQINLIPGSTTTFGTGTYSWALPATSANAGATYIGNAHLLGTARWAGQFVISPNQSASNPFFSTASGDSRLAGMTPTVPETFANGSQLRITVTYEAAA